MPFAVAALHPAIAIPVMVKMVRARFLKLPTQTLASVHSMNQLDTAVVDRVFETRMLPDGTIAVIPLNRNCLLRNINQLLRRTEADHFGQLADTSSDRHESCPCRRLRIR